MFRGADEPPIRTTVLYGLIAIPQIPWMLWYWSEATQNFGVLYWVILFAIDVAAIGVVGYLERRARRRPSFGRNLALHVLFFVWMLGFAFPSPTPFFV